MTGPRFSSMLATELRRATARRLVVVLLIAAFTGIAVAGVVVFAKSSRTVGTHTVLVPGQRTAFGCEPVQAPVEEKPVCITSQTLPRDRRFRLVRLWEQHGPNSVLAVLAGPLILAAIFAGASMIGAEWRFGTIGVLLTWEPRRARVMVAKLLAVAAVAFLAAVVLEAALGVALTPAAVWRGSTAGLTVAWWRGATWFVVRIAFLTALFAVLGFAIGSVGRNTSAAIGAAFAYLLIGEAALRAANRGFSNWLIVHNAVTVVNPSDRSIAHHGAVTAALILVSYAAGLSAVAIAVFTRRDVT